MRSNVGREPTRFPSYVYDPLDAAGLCFRRRRVKSASGSYQHGDSVLVEACLVYF